MFFTISIAVILIALSFPTTMDAQVMQSGSFQLESDSINIGGARSVSSNFGLEDTFGEVGSGDSNSTAFSQSAGFQQSDNVVVAASSGGSGSVRESQTLITSLSVVSAVSSALLEVETSTSTSLELRYGLTTSYEVGLLRESAYAAGHRISIEGLEAETRYYFEIIAKTQAGAVEIYQGSFFTSSLVDSALNVDDLEAFIQFIENGRGGAIGDSVLVSWENPVSPTFDHVEVVYSPVFFPATPADGEVVYVGTGESFMHSLDLSKSAVHYYTVFVYSENGLISSGSVIYVVTPESLGDFTETPRILTTLLAEGTELPFELNWQNILFIQSGEVQSLKNDEVIVRADSPLTIKVPYALVPETLKTIVMTLEDPNDPEKVFSFLLRVDAEKEYYVASLAPLGRSALHPAVLTVFDFETKRYGQIEGAVRAVLHEHTTTNDRSEQSSSPHGFKLLLISGFSVLLLIILFFGWMRRQQRIS